MQTPDIVLMGAVFGMLPSLALQFGDTSKTRALALLCVAIPLGLGLWLLFGPPVLPSFVAVIAAACVAMCLLMRSWESRQRAEDAYWRAAGTLAGGFAQASKAV